MASLRVSRPAHRAAQLAGDPGDHDVLGVAAVAALGPETAAHVGRDGPHRAGLQAERSTRSRTWPRPAAASRPTTCSGRRRPSTAAPARGSIGTGRRRGWRNVRSTTTSQAANGSPSKRRHGPLERHVGAGVRVEQGVAGQRLSQVDHGGQRVVVDDDRLGARRRPGPGSRRARPPPVRRRSARRRRPAWAATCLGSSSAGGAAGARAFRSAPVNTRDHAGHGPRPRRVDADDAGVGLDRAHEAARAAHPPARAAAARR